MSYVQLARAKAHLRVTHAAEDELIQAYIDAAESYAASYMGRPSIDGPQDKPWSPGEVDSDSVSSETPVPAAVAQAILLLVGDFFALREAQVVGTLAENPAAHALLHFHRVGLGV